MGLPTVILIGLLLLIVVGMLFFASYSIKRSPYLRSLCHLDYLPEERVVAITFDDGPHPTETARVLEVLAKHGVKATFFLIGKEVERYPDLVKRIVQEGHVVGNHAYEHRPIFPLFSLKKMRGDLQKAEQVIEQASGQRVQLFRPPFGVTNPTVGRAVRALGYQSIGWSLRTFDTTAKDFEEVMQRIWRLLRPNDIILLHDRMPFAAELLEVLLTYLREEGYVVQQIK